MPNMQISYVTANY